MSKSATYYFFCLGVRIIVVRNPTVFSKDYLNVLSGKNLSAFLNKQSVAQMSHAFGGIWEYGRTEEGWGNLWFLENISQNFFSGKVCSWYTCLET